MATPHVSAMVALIASAHPWMAHRPILLIGYLKLTAQDIHGNKTPALSATDTSAGDRTGSRLPDRVLPPRRSGDQRPGGLRGGPGRRGGCRPVAPPTFLGITSEPARRAGSAILRRSSPGE